MFDVRWAQIRGRQRDKQIAIRTTTQCRAKLEAIAEAQRWSFAETVEKGNRLLDEKLKLAADR